jgi:hypothetical protein
MARSGLRIAALCLAAGCTGRVGDLSPPLAAEQPDPRDPEQPIVPPPKPPPFAPGPLDLRHVLAREYRASVRDLFGEAAAAVATPPADAAVNGLEAIGATQLALSDAAIAAYEASANAIAEVAITDALGRFVDCVPADETDVGCMRAFVGAFGRRAFRRPLESSEVDRWAGVGTAAATRLGSFEGGLEWVISGMLQSPFFLYRVELGETEGDRLALPAYELASRLSFFLTGSGPDEALLEAADRGHLDSAAGVRTEALRLLQSAAAKEALAAFYDEIFRLRELATLPKDRTLYPSFDADLRAAMREETQRLIADIVWDRGADYRELYTASHTFVNTELAAHSGLPAPSGTGFSRVEIPSATKRGGLLGQSSFLTLFSHSVTTSPTHRGKFVREVLLCQAIAAPPPNVNTNLPEDQPGEPRRTMRERLIRHQEDPSCAGCHVVMDGPGLGLENFDAIGGFRTTENGATIDAKSVLDRQPFEGAGELGVLVAANPRASECIVRQLFRQATGHVEIATELAAIKALDASFVASQYKLQTLLVEIVASDAFRFGTVEAE